MAKKAKHRGKADKEAEKGGERTGATAKTAERNAKANRNQKAVELQEKSREQLIKELFQMAERMVKEIESGESPSFYTLQRGKANVIFEEDVGHLQLGERYNARKFLNIAHARKFMQTNLVMSRMYSYLKEQKTAALREIYYELKHNLEGTHENTFEEQTESDDVLEDLEHSLNTIRERLNLHAEPRGALYGDITLQDTKHNNDIFNAGTMGRGGWAIMSHVEPEEIKIKEVNADYLLVIETAAMYERLIEENFSKKNNAILITTSGQAARGARRLIARIHNEKELPVYVFTDGDPYGWYIYSVIKQGSMALAAHSHYLSVPAAKFVGMTLEDVDNYKLQQVTEKMKEGDIKRAKEMMDYPWFKTEEWQKELKMALDRKIRIEQQALASKSLSFVAEKYLPEKIKKEIFLP